jgi:hypothetical protein
MKLVNYLFSVAALVAMASCGDNDELYKGDYKEITLDATQAKSVYFSFEKDSIVAVTDAANSLSWDFAVYRYNFKTNSGKSGKGPGGAVSAYLTSLEAVAEAPSTGYVVDDSLMISTGFDPVTHMPSFGKISGNLAITGPMPNPMVVKTDTASHVWSQTYAGNATTFIPTMKVFVIKTALGKYAKIQVLDYYKEGKSGFVKIRYYYQADGNRKFGK